MQRKWITTILAIALVLALGWGFVERLNRMNLANSLEATGRRDFYNLLSQVEQAEVSMAKSLAAGSTRQQVAYLTETWNQAANAQTALTQLPLPNLNLTATRKFLSQTSDYCYSLAQKLARGENLSPQELDTLSRLHTEMGRFARTLHETEARLDKPGMHWAGSFSRRLSRPPRTVAGTVPAAAPASPLDGFVNIDRRMQALPSLTYDGPFSDHLERKEPRGLAGPAITRDTAGKRAQDFLRKATGQEYRLQAVQEVNGRIPGYSVTLQGPARQGETVRVEVSKKGGQVVSFLTDRLPGATRLDASQAVDKATAFLKDQGFADMVPTYSIRQGGNQVITFVNRENGVLIYPDQVKVKVALDDGKISGFDAMPYFMSHYRRQLPAPKLTAEEVRQKINARLQPESLRLALIPLNGDKEVLTYEVKAKINNDRFFLYYNALTGEEEKVLKVINLPGGQLTM